MSPCGGAVGTYRGLLRLAGACSDWYCNAQSRAIATGSCGGVIASLYARTNDEVLQRHWLVVPFGEIAHQCIDVLRRVERRHARGPFRGIEIGPANHDDR